MPLKVNISPESNDATLINLPLAAVAVIVPLVEASAVVSLVACTEPLLIVTVPLWSVDVVDVASITKFVPL